MAYVINQDTCVGCGTCEGECETTQRQISGVIETADGCWVYDNIRK